MRDLLFFLVTLLVAAAATFASETPKQDEAIAAAEAWLALVDQGDYAQSWEQAAAYFRNAVAPDRWKQSLSGTRPPLGKVISRKVKTAHYATQLPGAPDGEYVVIQFATSFENKRSAIETVTPMLEEDGTWRVSGYFIK